MLAHLAAMEYENRPEKLYFKEIHIDNQGIICVYTEGYHYSQMESWQDTLIGKSMLDFLNQSKYDTYLKTVFFDNLALINDSPNLGFIDVMMECILHWTFTVEYMDAILEVTICSHCMRLSSINFNSENIPMYDHIQEKCMSCINMKKY